jgi:hypothetical protein
MTIIEPLVCEAWLRGTAAVGWPGACAPTLRGDLGYVPEAVKRPGGSAEARGMDFLNCQKRLYICAGFVDYPLPTMPPEAGKTAEPTRPSCLGK